MFAFAATVFVASELPATVTTLAVARLLAGIDDDLRNQLKQERDASALQAARSQHARQFAAA